jgi:acyl-[acyl carrier protein]--UDP-N-acetylglucosamine O-acyltransferase
MTLRPLLSYQVRIWGIGRTGSQVDAIDSKRADFDEEIREIREVFPVSFRKGRNFSLAIKEIEERGRANEDVLAPLEFIKSRSAASASALNGSRS